MYRLRYLLLGVISFGTSLMLFAVAPVLAVSANISHSYYASSTIPEGSIVSLNPHRSGYVQLSNSATGASLIGVALASQDSLLAIDPTANTSTTVQVATSGSVNTLVTTANGDIKVGDQISVSPFDGIGMEAAPGTRIIGIAQTAFSRNSAGAISEKVKDKLGKSHQVVISYIRLSIGIGTSSGAGAGGSQANFLQKLVKSLTGHTISTARIVLSGIVTFVALISLITIIYASIYGSIISIGRNPLARQAVFRTLTSVMIMAVVTVIIAGVAIYYLLR
jgi:hypothetical protein